MNESAPQKAERKRPNVLEVQLTVKTLEALVDEPRFLKNLDPKRRLAVMNAAKALAGRPPRKPRPTPVVEQAPPPLPEKQQTRPCYVCGRPDVPTGDAMCVTCRLAEQAAGSALDQAAVAQVLKDRVVVVTGGRVNIGFATALRALRLGARVIITTRFAQDAAARFAQQPDSSTWRARLQIEELDLRDLPRVERWSEQLAKDLAKDGGLDVLIHNAAQTVPLTQQEQQALSAPSLPPAPSSSSSADLVDALLPRTRHALAPTDGPYGVPPAASWAAHIADVGTRELLEVLLVNAAAPFVITRALLPALKACARKPRVVVNVTSSEGRFSRSRTSTAGETGEGDEPASDARSERAGKSARHPHLNMAKAALNMLTRTSAAEFAEDDVTLVAVDPGWVSGPEPKGGFHHGRYPLDADEAAARVLHPVLSAVAGDPPRAGVLFKNFRPSPW